jgi:hypothetical protein
MSFVVMKLDAVLFTVKMYLNAAVPSERFNNHPSGILNPFPTYRVLELICLLKLVFLCVAFSSRIESNCGQLFPLFYGILYAPIDSVPEEQKAQPFSCHETG